MIGRNRLCGGCVLFRFVVTTALVMLSVVGDVVRSGGSGWCGE